jgi:signal peptidase I
VVFKYPQDPSLRYIKRIIGLPGELLEIKDGKVMVFDEKGEQVLNESDYLSSNLQTSGNIQVKLGDNEYFVLGDNRPSSSDSRRWGSLPRENIIGRVFIRAWPVAALAKFEAPAY